MIVVDLADAAQSHPPGGHRPRYSEKKRQISCAIGVP